LIAEGDLENAPPPDEPEPAKSDEEEEDDEAEEEEDEDEDEDGGSDESQEEDMSVADEASGADSEDCAGEAARGPAVRKAAAAMAVNVGHWSDPESVPGLAHFCGRWI
jgi:hypothetical protein